MVELNFGESQLHALMNKSNLDVPIALKKSVWSCSQYPTTKFVSYHRLNQSFKAFTTNLSNVNTLKTTQDALESPKWREAMLEETRALHKNEHGQSSTLDMVEFNFGESQFLPIMNESNLDVSIFVQKECSVM